MVHIHSGLDAACSAVHSVTRCSVYWVKWQAFCLLQSEEAVGGCMHMAKQRVACLFFYFIWHLLSWHIFFIFYFSTVVVNLFFPACRQSGRWTSGRRAESRPWSGCRTGRADVVCARLLEKQPVGGVERACGLQQIGRCAARGAANGVALNFAAVIGGQTQTAGDGRGYGHGQRGR